MCVLCEKHTHTHTHCVSSLTVSFILFIVFPSRYIPIPAIISVLSVCKTLHRCGNYISLCLLLQNVNMWCSNVWYVWNFCKRKTTTRHQQNSHRYNILLCVSVYLFDSYKTHHVLLLLLQCYALEPLEYVNVCVCGYVFQVHGTRLNIYIFENTTNPLLVIRPPNVCVCVQFTVNFACSNNGFPLHSLIISIFPRPANRISDECTFFSSWNEKWILQANKNRKIG